MGSHILRGIRSQCYLPPGRGDSPCFTPAKLVPSSQLATPEGFKAEYKAAICIDFSLLDLVHCCSNSYVEVRAFVTILLLL